MSLVEYKGVNIYQEELIVLRDIDFQVDAGEFVYLCGKVGSGKSSFLKSLYADTSIKGETAHVFSYNLLKLKRKDIPMLRRQIGVVFQEFQLLGDRSVNANLEFVLRATGWSDKHKIAEQIDLVLDTVGMQKKGYKRPHQLSGGEQQRIVIARALLNSPQLIIADEPTGNLDPETSRELMELLHAICKSGTAVLMATHNMSVIDQYPGRIVQCSDEHMTEISSIAPIL